MQYYRHPGYAWASTRPTIQGLGGLYDKNIVGNGDKHMAFSVIGKAEDGIPEGVTMSPGFMNTLFQW